MEQTDSTANKAGSSKAVGPIDSTKKVSTEIEFVNSQDSSNQVGNDTSDVEFAVDLKQVIQVDEQDDAGSAISSGSAVQTTGTSYEIGSLNLNSSSKVVEIEFVAAPSLKKKPKAIDESPDDDIVGPSYSSDPTDWDRRNEGFN